MSKEYNTENFQKHQEVIGGLSIVDIARAVDYINKLATFIPQSNEVLDDLDCVVESFIQVQNTLRTDRKCPKCGHHLFLSDVPGYEYVCPDCDENFFECEV